MKVLGIESSCDETAAAVVEDGRTLLSNVVATQIDIHTKYGGVVPEVAARSHIEAITPVIQQALDEAHTTWDEIEAIGVTHGPGLSGSLLIGTLAARTLAYTKDIPLYGVNHLLGHVYANFLLDKEPQFPLLALIVSGGHTQLILFEDHLNYRLLGQTQDDAVGEAFDKVAKILGLPYPGGVSISKRAPQGDENAYTFPKARMQNRYDFSFSGLKTAVLRKCQEITSNDFTFPSYKLSDVLSEQQISDVAASFQKAALSAVVDKTVAAFEEFQPKTVVIGGGVAASEVLRSMLKEELPIDIDYAHQSLCTDNAAMIATLTYYQAQRTEADSPFSLGIEPSLSI